jgi:hypothetical protein
MIKIVTVSEWKKRSLEERRGRDEPYVCSPHMFMWVADIAPNDLWRLAVPDPTPPIKKRDVYTSKADGGSIG